MNTIAEMITALWDLAKEIASALWPMIKTSISFSLWVLAAVFILPCVFVAGNLYPLWEEWSKNF